MNLKAAHHVLVGNVIGALTLMKRKWLVLVLLLSVASVTARAARSVTSERRELPASPVRLPERLLPTPPVIVRFGSATSDPLDLLAGQRASTQVYTVCAETRGLLEFVCSPRGIISWGEPLLRIYDLQLLGDLARIEDFASRIGSLPFVIAPRDFPAPLLRAAPSTPPPPLVASSGSWEDWSQGTEPFGHAEEGSDHEAQAEQSLPPPPPPPRRVGEEDRKAPRDVGQQLAAAEERVAQLGAIAAEARAELKRAEQNVAPFREDVEARRRLAEAGVIARNDVKAAEERLAEAEAAVSAARERLSEAEAALAAAERTRDKLTISREPPELDLAPAAPPPALPYPVAGPLPPAPPPPRHAQESRQVSRAPESFPSPTLSQPAVALGALAPPPDESLRLAPSGDLPPETWAPLVWPQTPDNLTRRRWHEQVAPGQCVVSRALVPQGALVEKGTPVLELRGTSVARLTAEVGEEYVGLCRVGVSVEVQFPAQGVIYRGWLSRVEPTHTPRPPGARIEILLTEDQYGDRLVYRDLESLALTWPATGALRRPLAYNPPPREPSPSELAKLFPLPSPSASLPPSVPEDGQLSGRFELYVSERPSAFAQKDPVAEKKLQRLREWHDSFVEGMKTTVFPDTGLVLTYPREGEISRAVERMATGRVSHIPNMCARTLAEALGWGLGDAAMWAVRLPSRGYQLRPDGVPRPGDILVWPFTHGPRRSQHVGIAVGQAGTIMVLSNEGGVLGTQPLTAGYLAFYKPPKSKMGAAPTQ